jgi:TonB-dependent receptor
MGKASGMTLMLALAAGTAWAQDKPAAPADDTVVVVTGVRASMRSSAQIKKNTQEIVDSITAEDIGKLPDNNVAETLTRIPGVQGYRYGGEGASPVGVGSGLTIRGLSGQTASQVDGRSYATAGLREFNIEDAIPGMIAGADVYKNPNAEHIEGGIGGLINLRTRHPSDFKKMTFSLGVTARYNDLQNTVQPEIFGVFANKWDLASGGRVGLMVAATYQKSEGRSDNNPANGGAQYRRSIRADDAEYATLAAANTTNDPQKALSAYVGRQDVWALVDVPSVACDNITTPCNVPNTAGLTSAQIANIMTATAQNQTPVGEEIIKRERKGLDVAADWVVNDHLRLYAEANYTYYMYNQNYMFLNSIDGRNVQNLKTTPFSVTEGLANRNLNGGSDDVLVKQRLAGGTFLNSDFTVTGGDEHHPYWTAIAATGFEWKASDKLQVKGDLAMTRSQVDDDNRSVNIASAPGLWTGTVANRGWSVTRDLTGAPHTMSISGPDLGSMSTWVYNFYNDGTHFTQKDSSTALRLDAKYDFDSGFFTSVKAGVRLAHVQDQFNDYRFTVNYNLTTDAAALANGGWFGAGSNSALAYHANGIPVLSAPDLLMPSIGNFMHGDAGYSGGFLVYDPALLLGDRVHDRFPLANIPLNASRAEQLLARRFFKEDTSAFYVMGDFTGFDGKIKGNAGVRVVQTDTYVRAIVNDTSVTPNVPVQNVAKRTYTDTLPSLNVTYYFDPNLLLRFGYSKGITRPAFGDLNPSISVNSANGTGSIGNANQNPLRADNYDLSLEKYFNSTSYVSFAVFDKELDGFTYGVNNCETVPFSPAPTVLASPCTGSQYLITRTVNAGQGYARGAELAVQTFFDFLPGVWKHFGAVGSFSYVDASNPVNFGTAASPRIVDVALPFQSKYNYSLQGVYDDGKLSARVVYTWRSDQVLFGVSVNPIDGRGIGEYGILDASINYKLNDNLSLTFNGNNLTDKGLDRFVGEPKYNTGIERQHYVNGRTYSIGLRYKFGG